VKWVIDYLPQEAVLRVTTSGIMDRNDHNAFILDALAAGKAHGTTRFLVDHREMTTALSIEEVFDLPTVIAGLGVERKQRAAIVYRADSASRDDFFFYDARNMSMGIRNVRLFTDPQNALEWLAETD
jgi:hypothetical protein